MKCKQILLLILIFIFAGGFFIQEKVSSQNVSKSNNEFYFYDLSHEDLKTQNVVSEFLEAAKKEDINKVGAIWYGSYDPKKLSSIIIVLNKMERYVHVGSSIKDGTISYEPFYPSGESKSPEYSYMTLIADPSWPGWEKTMGYYFFVDGYRAIFEGETLEVSFSFEVKNEQPYKPYVREISIYGPKKLLDKLMAGT